VSAVCEVRNASSVISLFSRKAIGSLYDGVRLLSKMSWRVCNPVRQSEMMWRGLSSYVASRARIKAESSAAKEFAIC
jgi:hypothetical protein